LPYNEEMRRRRTLYIKNPAAHRLAEQLSKRMGVTLTDAVIHALEEQARGANQAIDRDKNRRGLCEDAGVAGSRSPHSG
jgi:hypothetical protein